MIAALCWIISSISGRFGTRKREAKRELTFGRAVLSSRRDQYDLNPAFRVRTRIPKVGDL